MLYGWMKSLIIYLIFAGAVINLSPSGSYKKYIRFFTGIVAIIILMEPIAYIFNFDESKVYSVIDAYDGLGSYDEGDVNYDELIDYYDLSLSEGIRLELQSRGFAVEQLDVITDKEDVLIGCRVYVSDTSELEKNFEENNIKKYINEVYYVDVDNIYVVRR